jgi:hypothetical protein
LSVLNAQTLKVKNVFVGDRCVKFHLATKSDNFEWSLVVVYGAAQDAQKGEFLAELVCTTSIPRLKAYIF